MKYFLSFGYFFLGVLGHLGATFAQLPMQAIQVSESSYYVQGYAALGNSQNKNFISNAGFIIGPTGVVVIDALGSPAVADELISVIRKITVKPITHVIVTHYHADHVYGLQSYKQVGAQVIAHTLGKSYLYSETTATRLATSKKNISPWLDSVEKIIPADLWIDRQSIMQIAGLDLMIKPIGHAHTAEDLVVYLPSEKVLFAGDLIFSGRIPYVGNADSLGWVKALREVAQMDINVLVAGHGKVSTQPRKDLQFVENYLLFLRTSMKQAASEMEPFEEAYKKINWSQYAHIPLFNTANRINAYNIYLALEKE